MPDGFLKFRVRHRFVDEAPIGGALSLHAFLDRAEDVGQIAAHFALIGDAGQPARARKHSQQRNLRQRHVRGAIVGENDVVASKREFVAAAGTGTFYRADIGLAGFTPGCLQSVAESRS